MGSTMIALLWLSLNSANGFAASQSAEAYMTGRSGSNVEGRVDFSESDGTVVINYKLSGLTPYREHGFHIHEKGNCTSHDAKSAGGHFQRIDTFGGTSLDFPGKYAGDLPQITANESGEAEGTFVVEGLSISGRNAVTGRSIILHAHPDNITLPAAPRIACGVIHSKE